MLLDAAAKVSRLGVAHDLTGVADRNGYFPVKVAQEIMVYPPLATTQLQPWRKRRRNSRVNANAEGGRLGSTKVATLGYSRWECLRMPP